MFVVLFIFLLIFLGGWFEDLCLFFVLIGVDDCGIGVENVFCELFGKESVWILRGVIVVVVCVWRCEFIDVFVEGCGGNGGWCLLGVLVFSVMLLDLMIVVF